MKTAKVFRSGNGQAVRIPREFQLESGEVESWAVLINSLTKFTDDFLAEGRRQPSIQKRDRTF